MMILNLNRLFILLPFVIPAIANCNICDRNWEVVKVLKRATKKTRCQDIKPSDLAKIRRIKLGSLHGSPIHYFNKGDFDNLSGLESLEFSQIDLRYYPKNLLSDLKNLKKLRIKADNMKPQYLSQMFSDVPSLVELELESKRLRSIDDEMLSSLKLLRKVILNLSELKSIHPDAFKNQSQLRIIKLHGYPTPQIKTLPKELLYGLPQLKDFRAEMAVDLIPEDFFSKSRELKVVILGLKKLKVLPQKIFSELTNLSYLKINFLEKIFLPEGIFKNQKKLKTLKFIGTSYGGLANIGKGLFRGLDSLKNLEIYRSDFEGIPEDAFGDLKSLETLELTQSPINGKITSKHFSGLTSLQDLSFTESGISKIEKNAFADLTSLTKINLSSNTISKLEEDLFSKLPSLQSIEFYNNRINSLGQKTFLGLKNLRYLSLSRNGLARLKDKLFTGLSSLEELRLDDNFISEFPSTLIKDLNALVFLSLQGNPICDVEPKKCESDQVF